jgi:hypothetical protein
MVDGHVAWNVPDFPADCVDHLLGRREVNQGAGIAGLDREPRDALALFGVEHDVLAEEREGLFHFLTGGVRPGPGDGRPEDGAGAALALPDLAPQPLPLAVGRPPFRVEPFLARQKALQGIEMPLLVHQRQKTPQEPPDQS